VPRKSLLRLLGEHCADAGERHALLHLSSRGGRDAYNAQVCCHIQCSLLAWWAHVAEQSFMSAHLLAHWWPGGLGFMCS
jgi:hypothetical protein